MRSILSLPSLAILFSLVQVIAAVCQSTGTDYVDLGGPYCLNTASSDYFNFGTIFNGCTASDSQGGVTPIVVAPNTDNYYCSDIQTNPDGVEMRSTCNVPGNELRKSQMVSGNWTIVIEGLTFAYMRVFSLNAKPQGTVTTTPTATFTVTTALSTVTTTQTITGTVSTTLPAKTVTVPSTTITKIVTITPLPVLSITNSYFTVTLGKLAFATTVKTVTQTTACNTVLGPWDRKLAFSVKKAQFAAKTGVKARSPEPTTPMFGRSRFQRSPEWAREIQREVERRGIVARTIDPCTVTVAATTGLPSVTTTVVGPASTITSVKDVSITTTVTPPPVTSFSGAARTTITTVLPPVTNWLTLHPITNVFTTNTIFATITSTIKVPPTGVTCIGS